MKIPIKIEVKVHHPLPLKWISAYPTEENPEIL